MDFYKFQFKMHGDDDKTAHKAYPKYISALPSSCKDLISKPANLSDAHSDQDIIEDNPKVFYQSDQDDFMDALRYRGNS